MLSTLLTPRPYDITTAGGGVPIWRGDKMRPAPMITGPVTIRPVTDRKGKVVDVILSDDNHASKFASMMERHAIDKDFRDRLMKKLKDVLFEIEGLQIDRAELARLWQEAENDYLLLLALDD